MFTIPTINIVLEINSTCNLTREMRTKGVNNDMDETKIIISCCLCYCILSKSDRIN